MKISQVLRAGEEVKVHKKLRDIQEYKLIGKGAKINITDKFIVIGLPNYKFTISIFELRSGGYKIMKNNKEIKFKPMEDEKQKAIDRGEIDARERPAKKPKKIKSDDEVKSSLRKKYYIASSVENADQVKLLAFILNSWGWEHTYDWTCHGSMQGQGTEAIREVAENEMKGVISADIVIMLLPGGRGTHAEFGMACAAGKDVILYSPSDEYFFCSSRMCSFYMLPKVKMISDRLSELLEVLKKIESEGIQHE